LLPAARSACRFSTNSPVSPAAKCKCPGDTHALLSMLRDLLTVHPLTVEIHETGLELAERYRFSIYDAMIAASALHAGCDTLWSEDMQHGMTLDEGLRIVDPFRKTR
jgi:predicted nucleic acid-binding protein